MNPSNGLVFYQPAGRGIENPDGQRPVRYFGKCFRIPRSEHGSIRQIEWEPSPADLRDDVDAADGRTLKAVACGVIERFEIVDRDSGDIWVMYRVPYRTTP
jgi:hypothetical protein